MSVWAVCREYLPPPGGPVLVVVDWGYGRAIHCGSWDADLEIWWTDGDTVRAASEVTHWMPLPPFPEKEKPPA